MITIEKLREIISDTDRIIATRHALSRMKERGITIEDITEAIATGSIIEQYPDDKPFPSCLVLGNSVCGKALHIVCSADKEIMWLISSYYPDAEKWTDNKIRRKI